MKKLLLAMTAIASLAFISKAATLSSPTGTSFESFDVDTPLDIGKADDGTTNGTKYWLYDGSSAAETEVDTGCVIKAADYSSYKGTKPAIAPASDVNALGIEADKRLTRTITGVGGGSVEIGSGVYFDTMVQFTATDTAPALADGDKLVVWLYGSDEADGLFGATTGLVVTAGYLADVENNIEKKNYFVGGNIEPNSWHRLTIKSLANISTAVTAPAGFVVFIDGVAVSSSQAKGVAGSAVDSLTPTATKWATANELFPSLVKGNIINARTLAAVDIEGTGMIDDISFTSTAPTFAVDNPTLVINWGEGIESVTYSINEGEAVPAVSGSEITLLNATSTVKITPVYGSGYVRGTWLLNGQATELDTFAISEPTVIQLVTKQELIQVGDTKFGSAAEFVAWINEHYEYNGEVKLLGDLKIGNMGEDGETPDYVRCLSTQSITLDLAGKTITLTNATASTAVANTGGTLTITNSTATIGKIIATVGDENNAVYAVWCAGGTTTIVGGIYDGDIRVDEGAVLSITGGSFVSTDSVNFYLTNYVNTAEGYNCTYADGYWTVASASTPEPEPGSTYKLTIPDVADATAAVTDADGATVDPNAIAAGTVVTVTWTASEGYKITAGATETITMDRNQTANKPTVKAIQYATVVITQVDNCTITVKNGETAVATGAKFDIDDKVELTVTRTPAAGYVLDNCAAEEVLRLGEEKTYEITAAVKPVYPDYIPENATADTKLKFDEWVTNKAGGDRDTASANMEAFLLNVAPSDAADEKSKFKITAITVDANGTVTVTTTTTNSSKEPYNGKVKVKGKVNLTDPKATWVEKNATHKFFKAFLEVQ